MVFARCTKTVSMWGRLFLFISSSFRMKFRHHQWKQNMRNEETDSSSSQLYSQLPILLQPASLWVDPRLIAGTRGEKPEIEKLIWCTKNIDQLTNEFVRFVCQVPIVPSTFFNFYTFWMFSILTFFQSLLFPSRVVNMVLNATSALILCHRPFTWS